MSKFKTKRVTAPNGFVYEVQVVDGEALAGLTAGPTPGAVGTEGKAERRTEDKAERATEDKAAPAAEPRRPRKTRPGAAARQPRDGE